MLLGGDILSILEELYVFDGRVRAVGCFGSGGMRNESWEVVW